MIGDQLDSSLAQLILQLSAVAIILLQDLFFDLVKTVLLADEVHVIHISPQIQLLLLQPRNLLLLGLFEGLSSLLVPFLRVYLLDEMLNLIRQSLSVALLLALLLVELRQSLRDLLSVVLQVEVRSE